MSVLVKEILGFKKSGDIGIEVEIESLDGRSPQPGGCWAIKGDDSLRNYGYEYYTAKPIKCDSKKRESIKLLTDALNNPEYPIVQNCPRTSVHVHLNILDHTPLQLWTAVATYWLLDTALIKYCGEEQRGGNVFCLRAKDGEAVIMYALRDLKNEIPFETLHGDGLRYSSQNLNAISKFGSLEYRGMRGVYDTDILDTWTTELYNIVHRSKRYANPAEMLDTYLRLGAHDFMGTILSQGFLDSLVRYGIEKDIKASAGLLCELCYAVDWEKWNDRLQEKAKKYGWVGRTDFRNTERYRDNAPPVVPGRRQEPQPAPDLPQPVAVHDEVAAMPEQGWADIADVPRDALVFGNLEWNPNVRRWLPRNRINNGN